MDKYARKTFIANYGEPKYYPENVYNREIPSDPIDIYMTSPPCQAFSLAGKRKGEDDKRGVLFYNSHEFIQVNKPRFFIFENVKGLLSDDSGKTFQRWIDFLGGKSVNGNPVIFPHEESVPYHVYYKVLNAKNYGIPQNRERVFIIGIRDDADNNFSFPKEEFLTKRLRDVLEIEVEEKYYLSDNMIEGFSGIDPNGISRTIRVGGGSSSDDKHNFDLIKVGYINQNTQGSQVYNSDGLGQTLCAGTHGYANGYVQTEVVGNLPGKHEQNSRIYGTNGVSPTLTTMQGGGQEPKVIQINPSKESGGKQPYQQNRVYDSKGISTTLCRDKADINITTSNYRIRKLTPIECFRLMDFPDTLIDNARKVNISDSQLYKQAGNSIPVGLLVALIKNLLKL